MKRSTREFLLDIDQNIERAIEFVKDLNFEKFCQDQKTLYAAVRAIAISSKTWVGGGLTGYIPVFFILILKMIKFG